MQIPPGPDSLTPEWLTEALRSTGVIDQAMVTAIQVKPMGGVEGITGQMARVYLHYDQPTDNVPTSLIAKFPYADPDFRGVFSEMYEKEGHFYETIAEQVNLRTPACYYNAMNVPQHNYVLLVGNPC